MSNQAEKEMLEARKGLRAGDSARARLYRRKDVVFSNRRVSDVVKVIRKEDYLLSLYMDMRKVLKGINESPDDESIFERGLAILDKLDAELTRLDM